MRNRSMTVFRLRGVAALLTLTTLWLIAAATPAAAETAYVELTADGLEPLGPGWAYEGWLIVDGTPVSTGTFAVLPDKTLSRSMFTAEVASLEHVSSFVLTIEPDPDPDPAPSGVHFLGGDFTSGTAHLTVAHSAALGSDFASASGSYILAAPSAGDSGDYHNGIWWLDLAAGPGPTLNLPTLPAGWVYEGWVVGADGPVSTGRFTQPGTADEDAAGLSGGPYTPPPFPGQDFINPAADLTSGYAAVVTVEPEPDNSAAPFTLKPLVDGNIDDVGKGALQEMTNMAAGFPTATANLRGSEVVGEVAHVLLRFQGLEDLGPGWAYEGWLITENGPVSTGTFTVDGAGIPSRDYFPTTVPSVAGVSAFVLTIEPDPDPDPAPSHTHLLAGDLVDGRAALAVGHPAALGTDFRSASGMYILKAPSAGQGGDYRNGIWWLDPGAGPAPTLSLPELPDGWVYEGWVAGANGPISTGRFTMATGEDGDGAGPSAGPNPGPPFPGQDFVSPAMDLTSGFAAVISVEPDPDNGSGPFAIKPLLDRNIDDVGEGVLQPMGRNTASLPWGTATFLTPVMIPGGGHTSGYGGIGWRSDLDVLNAGNDSATFMVQLLAAGQANETPQTIRFALGPGASVRYRDVFSSLFGFTGSGALRVLLDNPDLRVTSRTYVAMANGADFGQTIPGHTRANAVAFGQMRHLVGLCESGTMDSGKRTNIGLLNATGGTVEVQLDLLLDDDSLVKHLVITLQPYEQRQLNRVFPEAVEVGSANVWVTTPGGVVFIYGSVVNNRSNDPAFVVLQ